MHLNRFEYKIITSFYNYFPISKYIKRIHIDIKQKYFGKISLEHLFKMFALKFTVLSIIVTVAAGLQCPFQTGVMSSNQIENVLNESLSKLSAQNGPQYR